MFESTIEETDINSSIETVDKIAGGRAVHDNTAGAIVADRDKTASAGAIRDKIAEEEATDDNTVDPFIELAVDQVGEEADEDTIDKTARIEAVLDKIAGDEAINDNTVDPFEATIDNTIDLSIELVVLAADRVNEETDEDTIDKIARSEAVHDNTAGERVGELTVDPLIEAVLEAVERPTKKLRDPGSNPARIKTYNCLETERI